MRQGSAIVACEIRYKLNGVPQVEAWHKRADGDYRLVVRLNAGMGEDAAIGKAKRKAHHQLLEKLSGMKLPEVDDSGAIDADYQVTSVVPETVVVNPIDELSKEFAACQTIGDLDAARDRWRKKAKADNWPREDR